MRRSELVREILAAWVQVPFLLEEERPLEISMGGKYIYK